MHEHNVTANKIRRRKFTILLLYLQLFLVLYSHTMEHTVGQLVKTLRYKPEGHGIDLRWCHNHIGRTLALGSTQLLTEMSTRNISCGVKADGA